MTRRRKHVSSAARAAERRERRAEMQERAFDTGIRIGRTIWYAIWIASFVLDVIKGMGIALFEGAQLYRRALIERRARAEERWKEDPLPPPLLPYRWRDGDGDH